MAEEFITCQPFEIPAHWFVIGAMDFGWDHPQAQIQIAWDKDNDMFYLTHAWKQRHTSPNDAWGAVKKWQENVPVAWPHDGLQTEKGSGLQQKSYYEEAGFNMLYEKSTWEDGGNGVEAGVFELRDLMQKGKFKAFAGLRDFFDEFNQYHRDPNGKISKTMDDILDSIRYGYMMRREAVQKANIGKSKAVKINFASEW